MAVMKRIMAAAAAAALCASMAACGSKNESSSNGGDKKTESGSAGTMRDISSMDLVKEMKLGYNLGNSLDVCNADRDGDGVANETADKVDETLWGNPTVTKEQLEFVKNSGFDSVRIPVTWRDHMND